MFYNILNKKKNDEDIENMVWSSMMDIFVDKGIETDFKLELQNLYNKKLLESEPARQGMISFFEKTRNNLEDFFFQQVDVSFLINLIEMLNTIPCNSFKFYIEEWLKHGIFFKNKVKRISSVLSPELDIEQQFENIKNEFEYYDKSMWIVIDELMKGKEIYDKKDSYDMSNSEHIIERLSILEYCLLSNIIENTINNARKAIISYALNCENSDYLQVYKKACVNMLNNFLFAEKIGRANSLPTVDLLISEAIIFSNNYDDIDIQSNIDIFTDKYKNIPEFKKQFYLLNNVYNYLGLDIKI